MFRAFVERDASYDGVFLTCVRTTGIFCRPTCHARKPNRENVEFVATPGKALHAGYRPCKLCRPLDAGDAPPAWAARARRYFKRRVGVTFHAFQRSWRLGRAMKRLHDGATVTEAAGASGYASESGFREAFACLFGEAPTRAQGCLLTRWLTTPLGPMIGVASEAGLVLLEFVDRRALEREIGEIRASFDAPVVPAAPGDDEHLDAVEVQLREYFAGARTEFDVALDGPASPFQRAVWDRLLAIPFGERTTYSAIAHEIGRSGAARAVGRAVGENRVAIVVPCHRVVGSGGDLTGRALLALEAGAPALFARTEEA